MKKVLVYSYLIFSMIACSGSKNIHEEVSVSEKSLKNSNLDEVIQKVNLITEVYSNTPITAIARSKIRITKKGFQWEFVNVRTGKAYIIDTDHNFGSVTIVKKSKIVSYTL